MTDSYYQTRYTWDKNRTVVWKEIVRYLEKYISKGATVVDLGAGYCDFINNIQAKKKIAVDYSSELKNFAEENVEIVQSSVTDLSAVANVSVDIVFASNLLEHLTDEELEKTISEIKRVLKNGGKL